MLVDQLTEQLAESEVGQFMRVDACPDVRDILSHPNHIENLNPPRRLPVFRRGRCAGASVRHRRRRSRLVLGPMNECCKWVLDNLCITWKLIWPVGQTVVLVRTGHHAFATTSVISDCKISTDSRTPASVIYMTAV